MSYCTLYGNNTWFVYKRFVISLIIILMIIFSPMPVLNNQKASNNNLESQVKAAYIYNFTKFVSWNPQESNTKIIAVLGSNPIGDLLEEFSKKQPEGQSIVVKKNKKEISSILNCHLLFICQPEQQRLVSILKQLRGTNVLTVSDIPGFARQGGMIGFFIMDDKVKIEINLNAVNKAGLKINAKLLEIARIVSEED